MAESLKMSLHAQSASPKTAAHNDRSMYRDPATYRDRDRNRHGDWMHGTSSDGAERVFYELHFRADLDAINAGYVRNHHPERCMDMDAYRERHPLHEIIWQIGRKDAQYGGDQGIYDEAIATITDHVERAGGRVVSWDLHMDETTPHFHVRCAFMSERSTRDEKGEPVEVETLNVNDCLAAHGVALPDPTKRRSQHNCRIKTWTKDLRDDLEDMSARYVEQWGATLDTTPDQGNVDHEDMPRFRSKRQQQEEFNSLRADNDRLRADNDRLTEEAKRQSAQLAEFARSVDQMRRSIDDAQRVQKAYEDKMAELDRKMSELDSTITRSEEAKRALDAYASQSYEGVVTRTALNTAADLLREESTNYLLEGEDGRADAFDDVADYLGASSAFEKGDFFGRVVERVREALRQLVVDLQSTHDELVRERDDMRRERDDAKRTLKSQEDSLVATAAAFDAMRRSPAFNATRSSRSYADAPESPAEGAGGPDGPDMG